MRSSQQSQNRLKHIFIDVQRQQENITKQQKDTTVKEQASSSDSSMKSVLANQSPPESVSSQQVQSNFNELASQAMIEMDLRGVMDDA